jgi:hypothetical protein
MARKKAIKGIPKSEAQKTLDFLKTPKAFKKGGSAEKRTDPDEISDDEFYDLLTNTLTAPDRSAAIPLDLAPVPNPMPLTGDFKFSVQTPPPQPMVVEGLGLMPPAPPTIQGRVGYEDGGFRMGASGIASKTPEGVKYMPGMVDIGYKMPLAGGELDMSASRMLEAMPGGKRPFNVQAKFVKKFQNGGEADSEVIKDDEGYPLPSPGTDPKKWKEFLERYGEIMEEKERGAYFGSREVFDDGASLVGMDRNYPEITRQLAPYIDRSGGMSDSLRNREGMELFNGKIGPSSFTVENTPEYFQNGGEAEKEVSFEKKIANRIGLGPAYEASVQAPKDMGMSGDEGTQGDAVRHMVLMRETSKKYGPVAARLIGYGHEFGMGMLRGQSSQAREMDLDNNAVGLRISKEAGDDEAKFRELMSRALADRTATYYRNEHPSRSNAQKMLKEVPRKRAGGSPEMGEVSGRTFEEDGPETAKKMLKDVGRGVSYYPYDLLGAPVDVINLGLKGIDYVTGSKLATEKPVGGSAYLIDKSNKLGVAEKPTGSAAEELARFSSAFINPASGARATGRVLEKTGKLGMDVLEDLHLATTGQGGSKAAQMLASQARPSFVVRPKDQGIVATSGSYTKEPISRVDEYINRAVKELDDKYTFRDLDIPDSKKEAIKRFYDIKARNFFTRQAGTETDPVFRQLMEGKIEPYGRSREKFPDYLFSGTTTGTTRELPGGGTQFFPKSRQAIPHFNKFYDEALGLTGTRYSDDPLDYRPKQALASELEEGVVDSLVKKGVPFENINPEIKIVAKDPKSGDWGYRSSFDEFMTQPKPKGISGLLGDDALPPELRMAREKNELIYDISSYPEHTLDFFRPEDITNYLATLSPEQIEKMPFADIIAKASKYNAPRLEFKSIINKIKEGKPVPEKYFKQGISQPLTTYDDGYQWVRIETPEAVQIEGAAMGHSVGGYAKEYGPTKVKQFQTGEHEVWSLRNKKGKPAVTVQLENRPDGTKEIQQVKGNGPKTGNAEGGPVNFDEKVNDFLTNYIKPTYISEGDNYLTPSLRKYKEDLYQKYSNE